MASAVIVERPQRWDEPFDRAMDGQVVDRLLSVEPFRSMDEAKFSKKCSLRDILLNDARVCEYSAGDIIVREGDYGNSAFMVLEGQARVIVESLPRKMLGRHTRRHTGLLKAIWSTLRPNRYPETRRVANAKQLEGQVGQRKVAGDQTRVFLQDVPGVLDQYNSIQLNAGEFFGEVAALARTQRSATVIAEGETRLLEIRWQGLRDIMRKAPALQQHIDTLYRQNSLENHLQETPLLSHVSDEHIRAIASATKFRSYGSFTWSAGFNKIKRTSPAERIAAEPVIAEQGSYVNDLILIRSGFARLSRRYGNGERTLAYLGKGKVFGMEEIAFNWRYGEQLPLRNTLRAVGYVDVLKIPASEVEKHILPYMSDGQLDSLTNFPTRLKRQDSKKAKVVEPSIDAGLLEFIVEQRLMNGTETMIIDLDRCTRCDDCVRACASTHDNNPRFVRDGSVYGQYMFAQACMHCVDPVCMIGCPTGAIGRDEESGNVVINDPTCIGCATCSNSCPYQNINMVEIRNRDGQIIQDEKNAPVKKATKCDLCIDHVGGPACQRACPHDALVRMDMNDLPKLADWIALHDNKAA